MACQGGWRLGKPGFSSLSAIASANGLTAGFSTGFAAGAWPRQSSIHATGFLH
jgi:hypothetical protein